MSVKKVVTVPNLDSVFKLDAERKKIGLNVDNSTITINDGVLSANVTGASEPDVILRDVAGNIIGHAFSSEQ